MKIINIVILIFLCVLLIANNIFIPMDEEQNDHLRAYGIVYNMLKEGYKTYWLLNYRGGAFIIENYDIASDMCAKKGVSFYKISENETSNIINMLKNNNSRAIVLEKAPKIAVYSPPDKEPWDDAVTLVLEYADIEYDIIYDRDILNGELYKYEWVHLHHEDFTGQLDRFYLSAFNEHWFRQILKNAKNNAIALGYKKYWLVKRDVAIAIRSYIQKGGFLFSMCSATNSLDIALALYKQDNIPSILDGDGMDDITLDYNQCICFENFKLNNTASLNLADINYEPSNKNLWYNLKFHLKKFSPDIDPVPAMLTQNHTQFINEFLGRTSSYDKTKLKANIIILAYAANDNYVKYIHGNYGEGFFTFLAGHDPEDYTHYVNDPPTDLGMYKNSPGYRLILNNILFPASKQKKKKT